jgi:uncharacterized protein YecE (DUF72 family)
MISEYSSTVLIFHGLKNIVYSILGGFQLKDDTIIKQYLQGIDTINKLDSNILIGCSGWNYNDIYDKGGWLNVFYPDAKTKKLRYYSQFFNTVEMDSTFYKEFYLGMTKGLFIGLTKATPDNFKFSIKVPEIITHEKRLDVDKNVIFDFLEFLDKISPLKNTNKLGTIIIQLPPSFTIKEFAKAERFLDKLNVAVNENMKSNNHYSIEFRHPSWNTEGTFEMLRHYNIASVMTDSPSRENLDFLSDENNVVTNSHAIIRMHGRNDTKDHYWYNYLYSESELLPWADKIKKIKERVNSVYIYFNNHYGGKAIVNALQFKELLNKNSLTESELLVLEKANKFF